MTSTTRLRIGSIAVLAMLLGLLVPGRGAAASWIVGLTDSATAADLDAGTVTAELPDLGMVVVSADDAGAAALQRDADVAFVAPDATLHPTDDDDEFEGWDDDDDGPARSGGHSIGMRAAWAEGLTGAGTTVALIDTGVSTHPDLAGRVVHGQNFAGDGTPDDLYGHGTAMAGLVAGDGTASDGEYVGAAPDATILSVKVASADGAADVSQVLAAIQWTVSFRDDHGIDVLLLAYSTDSTQSATVDPLAYAVQRADAAGMLVVVTSGNAGPDGQVGMPGAAPAALTVGAFDPGTGDVAAFSTGGETVDGIKKPDLVAPGVAVVAPIAVNSTLASDHPQAVRGRYIRGSGTSHSAALLAGAAAVLHQAHPTDSVDHLRARLLKGADKFDGDKSRRGKGNFAWAAVPHDDVKPKSPKFKGDGKGSLHASRGSIRVFVDDRIVEGEVDVLGNEWDGSTWTSSSWNGSTWTSSSWNSSSWNSSSWNGSTWTSSSWNSSSWNSSSWNGSTWTGSTWTGSTWTSAEWR